MATTNYTKMTDADLKAIVEEYGKAAEKCRLAQQEQYRRQNEADEKEAEEKREKLLASDKYKTLASRYKDVSKRLADMGKERKITFNIPVTFTSTMDVEEISYNCYVGQECFEYDLFNDGSVTAKIGKAEGMNKLQKDLLQRGLDNVVSGACDEIFGLFSPDDKKERKAIVAEINDILNEAEAMDLDLTIDDLES